MPRKNNPRKQVRHPMMKKGQIPTDSHTLISCGKLETKLLKSLLKTKDDRFNVKGFSDRFNESRSNVYDALNKLIQKGLASKEHYGSFTITKKGNKYLDTVGTNRTVCRSAPDVSYVRDHKFTFEVPIKQFPKGWSGHVGILDKEGVQTRLHYFSKNNPILHTKFPDDVDVAFTTTKIIIKPKNIYEQDHSSASFKAIGKAQEIVFYLLDMGFKFTNENNVMPLIQTEGHFAEVNSLLSQFFEKHTKGFSVQDKKGKTMFWIDHSNGHREDETATEEARDRLNKAMFDIMDNDIPKFSEMNNDLNLLKSITSDLVKMHIMERQQMQQPMENNLERADYFG